MKPCAFGYASVFFLILFSMPSMATDARDCHGFWKSIFSSSQEVHQLPIIYAKEKPILRTLSEDLIVEPGVFHPNHSINDLVFRVRPDDKTPLGRVAKVLEKRGTALFFDDIGLNKIGGGGYSAQRRFKIFDQNTMSFLPSFEGRVIVLKESDLGSRNFQRILMHEAFHDRGKILRDQGIENPFHSMFQSRDGKVIQTEMQLYQKRLHTEEIHAYVNNFIFTSVKAHHRNTLKEIEKQVKLLPELMPRSKKLQQIRIAYNSVIDPIAFMKLRKEVKSILDTHMKYVEYVKNELSAMADVHSKVYIHAAKEGSPVIIQTEEVYLTLNNVRVKDGGFDMLKLFGELENLTKLDEGMYVHMGEIEKIIMNARKKGYFTAEDYLKLKDSMGSAAKFMRNPSFD